MIIRFQNNLVKIFAIAMLFSGCAVSNPQNDLISNDTVMKDKNTSNKLMTRIIDAWIDIDAQPEEVWETLVDFKSWETWNSFIPIVEGDLEVGNRMRIMVVTPGLKPMRFKPKVYDVIRNEKILWGGSFLMFIYRGDHAFLLEPISEGKTRFRQIERFMGPMVLFMGNMIKKTEIGYHQMNLALKEQVESKRHDNIKK